MQRKKTNINTLAPSKRLRSVGSAVLAFLFMILMQSNLTAQSNQVSGTVLDATGEALIGVTIAIQGKDGGAATDVDGSYSISAASDDVLEFSYVGFQTQLIPVNGQSVINLTMSEDSELLDEVVVIGYGTQKKSHLTGSISKVVNDDLDQIAVSRVDDALVGQVSGVNIQATSAEAGDAPTITIRGFGSINADSGPQPWTKVMPTGGVSTDPENLKGWFEAGATCVGMGSKLISKDIIANKDYAGLKKNTRAAIDLIQTLK